MGNKKKRKGSAIHTLSAGPALKKYKPAVESVTVVDISGVNDSAINSTLSAEVKDGLVGGVLFADEIETTTDTLNILVEHPELIPSKQLKGLRAAIHDYWRVAAEHSLAGNSLVSRISSALVDHRHVDALVCLSEMNIRKQTPKLGALQRWVRECDAVLTPDMTVEEQKLVWRVLDSILRTTQPEFIRSNDDNDEESESRMDPNGCLRWYPAFITPFTDSDSLENAEDRYDAEKVSSGAATSMKVLQSTPGPERRPPNKHPAVIYYSPPDTFQLLPPHLRTKKPVHHQVTGVPGAFVLSDVFEAAECDAIVRAAETVGLLPDEPVSGSAAQLASILAHNLIWLADDKFIEVVYSRIVDLLPPVINGGKVKGINSRFRLYRYKPGALYRPHIDGAWPASAIDKTTSPPSYVYDSDETVYSRLTMLIYLNDGFEGGCTTFFLPSTTPGVLEARPVKPKKGTVAFFPHGAAKGSLLHEGSGVEGDGVKYIIRTEVLYEVDKKERIVG